MPLPPSRFGGAFYSGESGSVFHKAQPEPLQGSHRSYDRFVLEPVPLPPQPLHARAGDTTSPYPMPLQTVHNLDWPLDPGSLSVPGFS